MGKNIVIHSIIFIIVLFFSTNKWPELLLLIVQLVYIPLVFHLVVDKQSKYRKWYPIIATPAFTAIAIIMIFPSEWNGLLSIMYLLFTLFIAFYGVRRFLQRGFVHIEEFVIDCGFIFLAVGGMWFVAYELGIDTGFSPLITWLTAIHFHYSAFLMLTFIGLLGRLWKPTLYPLVATLMIILPWVMAVGISFSRWIELSGVILYVIAVYAVIMYSLKAKYMHIWQKLFVATSFSAVGLTIIFACLYVLSNGFQMQMVTIEWMLVFHGVLNAFIFGLFGCIGWMFTRPKSKYVARQFPLSPIRKRFVPEKKNGEIHCLVDDMNIFVEKDSVAPSIIDFYEQTLDYRLFARVYWKPWFKPFAFIYKYFSRLVQQINLPLSNKQVEMTGGIYPVDEGKYGRQAVRAWVRKIHGETVFVALYSFHTDGVRTYMNIALPLPFTSMHGILAFRQNGDEIELTSERKDETMNDAGIYLAIGKSGRFRLPLAETFYLKETAPGKLHATHVMNICGIRFLTIKYMIEKQV